MKITEDVKTDQRLMNLAGYAAGAVDGIVGRRTRAAYERWERALPDLSGLDERTVRNLRTLLPEVQVAVRDWLLRSAVAAAEGLGYVLKVISGTRSWAEQDALYAKGRTAPGLRVTKARGGYSWHNFGLAFDVGLFTVSGGYVADDAPYRELVKKAGVPAGFEWGGVWTEFPDTPHFQYTAKGKTLAAARAACCG